MIPSCRATDTPVLSYLVMSSLGFKARVDPSLVCFDTCVQFIPEIHLWCDTCWPLGCQPGRQLHSYMHVAEVGCWDSIGRPAQWAHVLSTRPPWPAYFVLCLSIWNAKVTNWNQINLEVNGAIWSATPVMETVHYSSFFVPKIVNRWHWT